MSAGHPEVDVASLHAAPGDGAETAHPNLVLTTTVLASSLALIDGSVVNVALPAIGRALSAQANELQWLISAYLLPLSALLLLGGAAGDRYGRRTVLILGTALFGLASAACAFAPNLTVLIASRSVQGVGAALLMPNSLAILGNTFAGEARGRAIGLWASAGAVAGAVGPVLGGWLLDHFGWRAIFLINLPIALGAIGLAAAVIVEPVRQGTARLDWPGAVLATAGLGLMTWGLTVGTEPSGWTALAALSVAVGAIVLVGLVMEEGRAGERAMMPLSLFGSRSFVGLTILTLLLYGALGAILMATPYVLIKAAHYSGTAAGAALLPLPLVIAVTARTMGGLAGRLGPRLPLSIGPAVAAVGFLLMMRTTAAGLYWTEVFPAIVLIALGMAGAVAPLTTAVLSSVDDAHAGSASGFNSAIARIGGLVAAALLGGVFAARGAGVIESFHLAAAACAAAAFTAGACAYLLLAPVKAKG